MVKMQSAAEFLQRNSIWDRGEHKKNSVSILRTLCMKVAQIVCPSLVSRIWMKLMNRAKEEKIADI